MRTWSVVAMVAALAAPAAADEPEWRWGALPIGNYDADAGLGAGALGTVSYHTPDVAPYRASVTLQLFVTTELQQAHELSWDVLEAGHPRLRLEGRAGYYATLNNTYCGLGNQVTCDPAVAEAAADAAGLPPGQARADFVRRYYLRRFVEPWGLVGARWRLAPNLALFGRWRLAYYRPGTLSDRGPYPGSLHERDHPDGEPGLVSVAQVGVLHDTRDLEPAPTRGLLLEASVRGAHGATGSDWSFAGLNASGHLYQPLAARLISATRLVADLSAGDLPVEELGYVTGIDWYSAFGGRAAGRGIRSQRFIGRIKLIAQTELRWRVIPKLAVVGFADAAWIAVDWDELGGQPETVLVSGGAGLRWLHSPAFIGRLDLGVSPHEDWIPQVYLHLGHVF